MHSLKKKKKKKNTNKMELKKKKPKRKNVVHQKIWCQMIPTITTTTKQIKTKIIKCVHRNG